MKIAQIKSLYLLKLFSLIVPEDIILTSIFKVENTTPLTKNHGTSGKSRIVGKKQMGIISTCEMLKFETAIVITKCNSDNSLGIVFGDNQCFYDYQHVLDSQRLSLKQRTGEQQNWQNLLHFIIIFQTNHCFVCRTIIIIVPPFQSHSQ